MTRLLWVLCTLPLCAEPLLFFSKKFPGSTPAYVDVRLTRDGRAEYREAPDEEPLILKMAPPEAEAMFLLADKLEKFKRPLESGLKVANMGEKMFRWVDADVRQEAKFNYSLDLDAQALHEWFEKICESAQYYYILERTVKFDRMGVYNAILKLEAAWDKKRLVAVEQYLPLLDRVVKNESYLNIARERARNLAATFRGETPPKTAEAQ